jgi:TonB family protein
MLRILAVTSVIAAPCLLSQPAGAQDTAPPAAAIDTSALDVRPRMANLRAFVADMERRAGELVRDNDHLVGQQLPLRIRFVVRTDSSVSDARILLSSGNAAVDSAAIQLLRRTRFVPGERGGVPVPAFVVQPVRFIFPEE